MSQVAASNFPAGSDSPANLDDVQRAQASFIALLRDGKGLSAPVTLASAATTDIGGQNSIFVEISGTTGITSLGTNYNGPRFLRFTGALLLTHNATTLNLPGAANITTAAGDTAIAIPNQALNGWNVAFSRVSGEAVVAATVPSIQGAHKNLRSSAPGTSANTAITADEIGGEDTSNNYLTLRAVSLTLVCSGSGANGLDTGTLAGSTVYHKWVIYNPATATTAALLSLSSTAPTMPSGYTYKARVGAISTDGTGNKYPLGHVSFGADTDYIVKAATNVLNRFGLVAGVQGNPATPTWVAASFAAYVPSTACRVRGNAGCGGGANVTMSVAPNDQYGAAASTSNAPPLAMNTTNTGMSLPYDFAIESTNIYYNCNNANGYLLLGGWRDTI